jgi:hypothetical protein
MTDHVLLDDDDGVDQQFSSTNPFAQNAAPAQGDWKARLGAFARKAGDTVKQHATTAAAVAQVKLTEAKVKLNELAESTPEQPPEDLEISAPTGGRKVHVDWAGTPNAGQVLSSNGPPTLPPKRTPSSSGIKKGYGPKLPMPGSPKHSRTTSTPSTLSPSSSSGSLPSAPKSNASLPDYGAMARSASGSIKSPRSRVFGASLKMATSDANGQQIHKVPPVITDTIAHIMKKGLKEEGIFRIGGSHAALQEYKARYDAGEQVDLTKELDVNNVSGVLKMYLRELPEHLFTDHLLDVFNNALVDPSEAENVIAQLLPLLPETNLLILQQLFALLDAIAKQSTVNMMTIHNLGIIFTQCLRINGAFFAFLMNKPHLLKNAKATATESGEKDLIQW